MGLGIRGWRRVGLGICKVGGVGSRSNHAPLDLVFCYEDHLALRDSQKMALFHCVVRLGSARLSTAQHSTVRVGLRFHCSLVPL